LTSTSGGRDNDDLAAGSRSRTALIRRLRRIEGQVRGLQKMVEEDRDGPELLQQLASVRKAVQAAGSVVLYTYLARSVETVMTSDDESEVGRTLDRAAGVFRQWIV